MKATHIRKEKILLKNISISHEVRAEHIEAAIAQLLHWNDKITIKSVDAQILHSFEFHGSTWIDQVDEDIWEHEEAAKIYAVKLYRSFYDIVGANRGVKLNQLGI
jgi:flavorubredoxin